MLKQLTIQSYKGFQKSTTINFAVPNGKYGSGLNVFVGGNNSGKSTVFDALDKFGGTNAVLNDEEVQKSSRNSFRLDLIDVNNEKESTSTVKNVDGGGVLDLGNSSWNFSGSTYFVPTNRRWRDTGEVYKQGLNPQGSKVGDDHTFISFLQNIEGTEVKSKLVELIKRIVPDFQSYNVGYSNNQAYIQYTTGNNIDHKAGTLGDGVIGAFKLLSPLLEIKENKRILMIDEPELSLHPQAQNELIKIYAEYASDCQIILATHSPAFIDWESLRSGGQIIKVAKPGDKDCMVWTLDQEQKRELCRIGQNKDRPFVLDSIGKELFFGSNIVLCEGQTDPVRFKEFIKSSFDPSNKKVNFEFLGYGCGSDADILKFIPILQSLGLKVACIFDKPTKKDGTPNNEVQKNIDKAVAILGKDGVAVIPTNEVQHLFQENNYGVKPVFKNELNKIFESIINYFNFL